MRTLRLASVIGLMLAFAAPSVMAAQTAEISVTGTVAPGACTISGGSSVNLDVIPFDQLNASEVTKVASDRKFNLRIECPSGATKFALATVDAFAGLAYGPNPDGERFALKGESGGSNLSAGYWTIELMDPRSNQQAALIPTSRIGGGAWGLVSGKASLLARDQHQLGYTIQGTSGNEPVALKDLRVDATVNVYIAPKDGLPQSDKIRLNGLATVELKYI